MENQKYTVILSKDDFRILKQFTDSSPAKAGGMSLSQELERAVVLDEDQMPDDRVRLNSLVRVRELGGNRELQFCIVLPSMADIKQQRISVLTPMGAAIIGLRKGETIEWKMPAGMKKFKVVDVTRSAP